MTFYFPDIEKKSKSKKVEYGCDKCGLSRKPISLYGNIDSKLLIVGNVPDKESYDKGKAFIGEKGKDFRLNLRFHKLDLKEDFLSTYAIGCFIKKGTMTHAKCCRDNLIKIINKVQPRLIICLGDIASNTILNTKKKYEIRQLRNRVIPNYEFNCLVFPTYAPGDFMEMLEDEVTGKASWRYNYAKKWSFKKDIDRIIDLWKTKYHKQSEVNKILKERNILKDAKLEVIKTKRQLNIMVDIIKSKGIFAFDYETNTLKPFDDRFKIYSVSFAVENRAWGIYIDHFEDIPYLKKICLDLLQDSNILKYIQNDKYEEIGSRRWLNMPEQQVLQNSFCTMLATHVVDERKKCNSLDFQNLVRFGIYPYSDKVKKFLTTANGEIINEIHLCDPDDLVKYNNLDTLTTYANGIVLDKVLLETAPKYRECYNLLHAGHMCFADMEEYGVPVDMKELNRLNEMFTTMGEDIMEKIRNLPDIQMFFGNPVTIPRYKLKRN